MKQAQIESLLGRPLTSTESTNIDLYLKIAKERLSDLICSDLCSTDNRYYEIREGYQTVFTDIFTGTPIVKLDGEEVTTFKPYQNDNRNGKWFNSIVFDKKCVDGEVEIEADWGFSPMPSDLQLLQAKLFSLVSDMNTSNGNIKSKRVEDFSITFGDTSVYDQFVTDNEATIAKYSQCDIGFIRHGRVCRIPKY